MHLPSVENLRTPGPVRHVWEEGVEGGDGGTSLDTSGSGVQTSNEIVCKRYTSETQSGHGPRSFTSPVLRHTILSFMSLDHSSVREGVVLPGDVGRRVVGPCPQVSGSSVT